MSVCRVCSRARLQPRHGLFVVFFSKSSSSSFLLFVAYCLLPVSWLAIIAYLLVYARYILCGRVSSFCLPHSFCGWSFRFRYVSRLLCVYGDVQIADSQLVHSQHTQAHIQPDTQSHANLTCTVLVSVLSAGGSLSVDFTPKWNSTSCMCLLPSPPSPLRHGAVDFSFKSISDWVVHISCSSICIRIVATIIIMSLFYQRIVCLLRCVMCRCMRTMENEIECFYKWINEKELATTTDRIKSTLNEVNSETCCQRRQLLL